MSYTNAAEYINKELSSFIRETNLGIRRTEKLLNLMIELGRVAKFRCRSNVAYRNFISECFRDIAVIGTQIVEKEFGKPFETIRVLHLIDPSMRTEDDILH